jgi:acetyl-CoA carboxylase biotin carboxyl carrier protein
MAVDIRKIKKLIELLEESHYLTEIEIKEDKESIRLSRVLPLSAGAHTHVQTSHSPVIAVPAAAPISHMPAQHTTEPAAVVQDTSADASKHIVTSPMVGTVYLSPSPEAKIFVEVGQHIEVGQVLCIVEAMKMFNQIESDVAGKLVKKLVENGQPIEFGQPLFIIE